MLAELKISLDDQELIALIIAYGTSVPNQIYQERKQCYFVPYSQGIPDLVSELSSEQKTDKLIVETFHISMIVLEKAPTFSLQHQKRWVFSLYKSPHLQTDITSASTLFYWFMKLF